MLLQAVPPPVGGTTGNIAKHERKIK